MNEQENRWILFTLLSTLGIGLRTLRRLESVCSGEWGRLAGATAHDWLEWLPERQAKLFPDWQRRRQGIATRRLWEAANTGGRFVLTEQDEDYPALLRQMADPPAMLFLFGQRDVLKRPMIAVVGTRSNSVYGKQVTGMISGGLTADGWCVVSGLARGIDRHAHEAALQSGGTTIAVLAGGLDQIYPPEHRTLAERITGHGLLISEQPDGTILQAGLFPLRNRIIAGISHGTIVVEASERSGSLITADLALQYNREVFAVPGPVNSPKSIGPLSLLAEGAHLIRHAGDVRVHFEHLLHPFHVRGTMNRADCSAYDSQDSGYPLTDEERFVLDGISAVPTTFDELQEMTKYDLGQLHHVLLSLQLKNRIDICGPMQYVLKDVQTIHIRR